MKLNICGTSDFSVHHGRRSARRNAMAPATGRRAWRTAERHGARATGRTRRRRCLVPTQAAPPRWMPRRRSQVLFLSGVLFVAGSRLAGGWPRRRMRQPRGGRCPNYRPGVAGISFTVHPVGRRGPLDPQPTARIHYWSQLNGCLPRVLLVEALPRRPDTGGQPPRARRLSPPPDFPSTAAPRPAWTQPHPRVRRPHWSTQTVPVATKPK